MTVVQALKVEAVTRRVAAGCPTRVCLLTFELGRYGSDGGAAPRSLLKAVKLYHLTPLRSSSSQTVRHRAENTFRPYRRKYISVLLPSSLAYAEDATARLRCTGINHPDGAALETIAVARHLK